jgi:glycosyltransferase involved in cell wall biosynthesis
MPSVARYEGMPVVIVEALAAGTPIISYDFGPLPENIVDGKTGYIVDKSNIPDLAIAITHAIREASNLERSSSLCRDAATNFSIQRVSKSYYELFHKILNENK